MIPLFKDKVIKNLCQSLLGIHFCDEPRKEVEAKTEKKDDVDSEEVIGNPGFKSGKD